MNLSPNAVLRFAPTPTGHFHLGNLRTAWLTLRLSREFKRPFVVRFEDIDTHRVRSEFLESQRQDLKAVGMVDFKEEIQSRFFEWHRKAFHFFLNRYQIYPCFCSRKEIMSDLQLAPRADQVQPGILYKGTCRGLDSANIVERWNQKKKDKVVWRFRGDSLAPDLFEDFIVGTTSGIHLSQELSLSNFISFEPSYNWACALDDARLGDVVAVRAWDLAGVHTIQSKMFKMFQKEFLKVEGSFEVLHASLVVERGGGKLSKRQEISKTPFSQRDLKTQKAVFEVFARSYQGLVFDPSARLWGEPLREIYLGTSGE
jgi:glutamyl-tRNA synthetase